MTTTTTNTTAKKLLFVCKKRNDQYGISYGLVNSCAFIVNALKGHGVEGKVVQVVDGNCIDREVYAYNPTHVFIEAFWATPDKIRELLSLPRYGNIKWFVRGHSKVPFLANEGIAMEWSREYLAISKQFTNFKLASNTNDIVNAFKQVYSASVSYFPNIYCPPKYVINEPIEPKDSDIIDIGCFGAIRPMKNQLYQALAAMAFGNKLKKKVRFHINSNRVEQKGDPILKNIEQSFSGTSHELVKHTWMPHYDFINVVRTMDYGLQVSLTESFNIVAADFVEQNVPIVGSTDITWLNYLYKATPTSLDDIVNKLIVAYYGKRVNLQSLNEWGLEKYNTTATKTWLDNLNV
jgi:hypothetical protein